MSDASVAGGGDADRSVLNGRYEIQPDRPLPRFDSPMAKAVGAIDLRAAGRGLFALVCEPSVMPRIDVIPALARMARSPMLNPIDAGAVRWPQTGGRRFVIVFEQPPMERLMASPDATIEPMREDQVMRTVIEPLLPALKELSRRHIPHRAIRADNIFYADASGQAVVLGECVSAPSGISQPTFYEPIDAAMCQPAGRGPGQLGDDVYALGVLIVVLLSGGNPVADRSDDDVIRRKIDNGSYAALVSGMRVSLGMMEPLRGLLCDDPKERWTISNLEMWLGGRQLSPKQVMLPSRAARSLGFAGREYRTRQALSLAMGRNWSEARKLLQGGELVNWIRRSHADDEQAEDIGASMQASGAAGNEDQALSRALMLLEPSYPIRFKDLAARADGIAPLLAAQFHDPAFRSAFAEMMRAKLPQTLLQSQRSTRSESGQLMKTFDMITYFADRPSLGGGMERALYESNRGWPCQSPLIRDQYVAELEDLLPALEVVARRGRTTGEPVDPHIVGFCAVRNKSSDRPVRELNSRGDLPTFRLGVLRLLADVQRQVGSGQRYPSLSQWVAELIKPIVETFHNRAYRAKLSQEIEKARGNGDLVELLFLVDSLEARDQDTRGFLEARAEYVSLGRTIKWLAEGGLSSKAHVEVKSQHAATIISAVASGLMIVGMTLIYVT